MFEFFFQHSPVVFRKGEFVLLGSWPVWLLPLFVLAAAGGLGWWTYRRRAEFATGLRGARPAAIWALQTAMAGLLLVLLWHPAVRVSALKPQQNVVAVVVDDSRSMALLEGGQTRLEKAAGILRAGLLDDLGKRFQIRLYRLDAGLQRIGSLEQLSAARPATRIGDSLRQVALEAAAVPVGAVVLLSDGADNSGGIDAATVGAIRGRRIPVHTIGIGRERFERDIEIAEAELAPRALAGSRLLARVAYRQRGYAGRKGRLALREGNKILAAREIVLAPEGSLRAETLQFNAGAAGAKRFQVSIDVLEGEENAANNAVSRLVNVEASRPRILYLEGEPRWEYKFIRRALESDRSVQLVSILRTTENKIYRQGIAGAKELEDGFPSRIEQLFAFQGIVLGSVEAGYLTPAQQEGIRQFADRRGGGVLFLGGRAALGDGGYAASPLAEVLPVVLPERKPAFRRDRAGVELTPAGRESLVTLLEEEPEANAARWEKLPKLADYQDAGVPKPGAAVLADLVTPAGDRLPLLVTQNYGRGRTAVFASGGSWRWQMQQPLEDLTHEAFWQQLLRWLVTGAPGRVSAATPRQMLTDEGRLELSAVVRDETYTPAGDARVEAHVLGPAGLAATVELSPDPVETGTYRAEWEAAGPGSYLIEVVARRGAEEAGRDVLHIERQDGVAESFRAEQNRELLAKLSEETGGRYYTPESASGLRDEISFSEAGITVRETRDLWNMPAVLLLLILLRAAEWSLRRKWGVV